MPNTVTIRTRIHDETKVGFGGIASGVAQLVGGAIIPATAAVAALGVELVGAGAAAGVFAAAVAPQISDIKELSTAQDKWNTAVKQYGLHSKQANKAAQEYNQDLKGMAPATRDAANSFIGLKNTFKGWSDSLAASTMPVLTHSMQGLRNIIPTLTPLVKATAAQFNTLAIKFEAFTKTDRFKELVGEFSNFASGALKNVIGGITSLSKALVHGFESQGFRDFLKTGAKEGPGIVKMFKDLAQFVGKFIQAAGPLAGLQLKVLEVLASALNAIPMDVLQSLVPVLMGAAIALKIFRLAMVGFEIIKGLVLGFQLLTGATLQLDAAMDANPVGLVVLALAALAAGLIYAYKHSETFRLVVQDSFDGIKLAGAAMAHVLLVAFKGLVDGWMEVAGSFVHGAAVAFGWVPGLGGKLKSADAAFGRLRDGVDDKFNSMISKTKDWESAATNSMRERKLKMDISDWTGKLSKAKGDLKTVPASKRAALLATISDLESKIRKAKGEIASVHGKTVTLYMKVVKSGSMAGFTNIGGIARRAGGQAAEGGMRGNQVLVGEGGPEIVNLPSGSYVNSNPDSRRMLGMASGGTATGYNRALAQLVKLAKSGVDLGEDLSYRGMPRHGLVDQYNDAISGALFASKGTGKYAPLLAALKANKAKGGNGKTWWQTFSDDFPAASKKTSTATTSTAGGSGQLHVTVNIGGKNIVDEIMDPLKKEIRNRGGITIALGS